MSNDLSVLPGGRRLGPTRFTDQLCYNPAIAVNTLSGGQAHPYSGRSAMVYLVYFPASIASRSHFGSYASNGLAICNHKVIGPSTAVRLGCVFAGSIATIQLDAVGDN
jgi:hypothetical protein